MGVYTRSLIVYVLGVVGGCFVGWFGRGVGFWYLIGGTVTQVRRIGS